MVQSVSGTPILPVQPQAPGPQTHAGLPTRESAATAASFDLADSVKASSPRKPLMGPPVSFAKPSTQSQTSEQAFKHVDPRFEPQNLSKAEVLDNLRDGLRQSVGPVGAPVVEGLVGVGVLASNKKLGFSTGADYISPGAKFKFEASFRKQKIDDALRLGIPLQNRERDYRATVTLRIPLGGE
jgi:hypothetical protein